LIGRQQLRRCEASWQVNVCMVRTLLCGAAVIFTANCRREAAPPPRSDSGFDAPLLVEWAGCAGIRKGPKCEMGKERRLTIWVAHSTDAHWKVITERGPALVRGDSAVDGGTRLTVEVPPGVKTISLADPTGRVRWSLGIGEVTAHEQIDKLLARGRSGKFDEALADLEILRERATSDERGPASAAIGRMALALGQVGRAEPAFRASIAAAMAEGRIADVVRDGSALVWALVMLEQRFGDARILLEATTVFADQYPEGQVWTDYHAGLLAAHTGDIRTALTHYRAAERKGRRLDRTTLVENASMEVAFQLTRLGRSEEAIAAMKRIPPPADPCARASWALDLAWMSMQRPRGRTPDRRDPEIWEALISAERATQSCPDPHRALMAIINSAEYALEIDDDPQIARLVAAMQALPVGREVLLGAWRSDVRGRWFLRQKKARLALTAFEDQIRMARGAGLMEEEFRGEAGAGRALLALGRRASAIGRLKAAQTLLGRMMRDVPLGEGRESFSGGHDDAVRTLVSALVDSGAVREALRIARGTRAAELVHTARIDRLSRLTSAARLRWDEALGRYHRIRSEVEHQAESDWTLPREALAQIRASRQGRAEQARAELDNAYRWLVDDRRDQREHELDLSDPMPLQVYLAFFPGPRGWYAFAATQARVIARRMDDTALASASEAAKVLSLFRSELTSARRVRFFPYGASDRVDWHAVPWNGQPLSASLEVEYGLDVPTRTGARAAQNVPRSALIVTNPTGDLPASTSEGDLVVHALASWQVTRLQGVGATRGAVLGALKGARLFHYAGHAEVAGAEGLSSALLLHENARIELGDLLASQSVPDFVVLSACDAASASSPYPSLMGLGQAFIAAGAQAVIAPNRPISDTAALAFMSAFYPAFVKASAAPGASIAWAFRESVRTISSSPATSAGYTNHVSGWESFRLLVP
jgi:CHAT domain